MSLKAIICDIEGTTTDIKFVHNVLFPYAQKMFPDFLRKNLENEKVKKIIKSLEEEYPDQSQNLEQIIQLISSWIQQDKKITQLKELQGLIWIDGYELGEFKGHIYPEVKKCLTNWKNKGLELYIYSSGSVFAQKLLFSHTSEGDLTYLFSGYFDTKVGHKREVESYKNIQKQIGKNPNEILFLSDIEEELDAAKAAGFMTGHLNRDGLYQHSKHNIYNNFDEVKI